MSDEASLRVVEAPRTVAEPIRDGPVAGVLLAAGTSSRFGEANKLLASVDGEPMVRRAGRTLAAAQVSPLLAVLGHEAERVREVLDGLGFAVTINPEYASGQATSVRAGIRALADLDTVDSTDGRSVDGTGEAVDAAVFVLGDMPYVDRSSIEALIRAYRAGLGTALAAACDGRRGNPVLFDASYFDSLTAVDGDVGGRELLLNGDDSALVETGDPGVLRDVDTPGDLRRE
jgi:molybdenum cofactor cytidylyltransferase